MDTNDIKVHPVTQSILLLHSLNPTDTRNNWGEGGGGKKKIDEYFKQIWHTSDESTRRGFPKKLAWASSFILARYGQIKRYR